MGIRSKISSSLDNLEDGYRFDRTEFGKVLLVASVAIFVVSVQSVLKFQSAYNDIESMNEQFDEVSVMINDNNFQDRLEGLQSLEGTDIGPRFVQISDAFSEAEQSLNRSQEAEQELERTYESYQWMVLFSILGVVAGSTVIYV